MTDKKLTLDDLWVMASHYGRVSIIHFKDGVSASIDVWDDEGIKLEVTSDLDIKDVHAAMNDAIAKAKVATSRLK